MVNSTSRRCLVLVSKTSFVFSFDSYFRLCNFQIRNNELSPVLGNRSEKTEEIEKLTFYVFRKFLLNGWCLSLQAVLEDFFFLEILAEHEVVPFFTFCWNKNEKWFLKMIPDGALTFDNLKIVFSLIMRFLTNLLSTF